jgi:para-nitrobenzyl esterase
MPLFQSKAIIVAGLFSLVACAGTSARPEPSNPLAGTSWQLDSIEYMDDTTITPDDRSKYTLKFDDAGMAVMKADCNNLRGGYTFTEPSGLKFGDLMSTRAMCPPGSLYDRVVKDMPFVRSFVIKDGRLHLALMADGGIYNYSPMP